eukprot:scaffold591_cov372-Prasinococcus_capsulatus_cf.AAC.10
MWTHCAVVGTGRGLSSEVLRSLLKYTSVVDLVQATLGLALEAYHPWRRVVAQSAGRDARNDQGSGDMRPRHRAEASSTTLLPSALCPGRGARLTAATSHSRTQSTHGRPGRVASRVGPRPRRVTHLGEGGRPRCSAKRPRALRPEPDAEVVRAWARTRCVWRMHAHIPSVEVPDARLAREHERALYAAHTGEDVCACRPPCC